MPVGDPTEPLPESTMRVVQPIGYALAALMLGVCGSALLMVLLVVAGGPDLFEQHATPVMLASVLVVFVLLVLRGRRRRRRLAESGPGIGIERRRAVSMLACGAIMLAIAVPFGLYCLRPASFSVEGISAAAFLCSIGAVAVAGGIRKLRALW